MTLLQSGQSYQLPPSPDADQRDVDFKNTSTSGSAVIYGNGQTIDGETSYTLESLASVAFRWIAGTGWIVIAAY
jgi:hypothetical protein